MKLNAGRLTGWGGYNTHKTTGVPRVQKTDLRRGGFDTLMRDVREDNCLFHNNRLR